MNYQKSRNHGRTPPTRGEWGLLAFIVVAMFLLIWLLG